MIRYKNLSRNSGVRAYEIASQSIDVQFTSGTIYNYSYNSTSTKNIETMKLLADRGRGLNSFIKKNVDKGYESKR